ncbi:MAG TPA: phospholipase D family protein [Tepidisphaeraceae bacterium]|nr:phospholipase D family protein [Tepidisphaeraceae bacterium]
MYPGNHYPDTMRHKLSALVLLTLLLVAASSGRHDPAVVEDGIAVYFSPDGGAAPAMVDVINGAQKTVDIAIFSITQKEIVKAIVAANKRGIKVRILLDSSQAEGKYSSATYLANAGVPIWTNLDQTIHHKYAIIDNKFLCTGSFNYSTSADLYNAENLLIMTGKPKLTRAYAMNFEGLMKSAVRYKSPNE